MWGVPRISVIAATCLSLGGCSDAGPVADPRLLATTGSDQRIASLCSAERFPTNQVNSISCCQDGDRTWHTNNGTRLVFRTYDGNVCTEADGISTNCGVGTSPFVPCTYGPCGAKNEWAVDAEAVFVFMPTSKPDKCGWEARGVTGCALGCDWPTGAVRGHPEPFVDQVQYGGTANSCPYTRCLKGGIPSL